MIKENEERNNIYFPFTPICNRFINNYMKDANPSFVIIYIYLLKENFLNNKVTTFNVAKELNILQTDILNSLKFWAEKKVINYSIDDNDFINIKFLHISEEEKQENKVKIIDKERSNYRDEEIDCLSEREEVKQLFSMSERILAKTFSYTDKKIILELYDDLGLSREVLATLFTYCATNNKTNLRYIEKIAVNWVEMKIDDTQKAEEYIKMFNDEYRQIMKALGIKDREPIDAETKLMKKWTIDFKIPMNIILEACERTVLKTGQSSFKYLDAILTNWYEKDAKTLKDIEKLDKKFYKEQKGANSSTVDNPTRFKQIEKVKNNKFLNYEQKDYRNDKLDSSYLKRLKELAED